MLSRCGEREDGFNTNRHSQRGRWERGMIVMLFAISLKASGLILKDFEFMGFFQIWLLFGFYYLVNMFIRAVYIMNKEGNKEV